MDDESSKLKERTLPRRFDNDEANENFSREGGSSNLRANLRLENPEITDLFKVHMPVVYP